jgi:hypothetical protein
MEKSKLKDLSKEQLKEKGKSLKLFIGVSIPLVIILFYFPIQDYLAGEELDWSMITISICTLGIPATLYPELKKLQDELRTRN